jgi:hypothetical protein
MNKAITNLPPKAPGTQNQSGSCWNNPTQKSTAFTVFAPSHFIQFASTQAKPKVVCLKPMISLTPRNNFK